MKGVEKIAITPILLPNNNNNNNNIANICLNNSKHPYVAQSVPGINYINVFCFVLFHFILFFYQTVYFVLEYCQLTML